MREWLLVTGLAVRRPETNVTRLAPTQRSGCRGLSRSKTWTKIASASIRASAKSCSSSLSRRRRPSLRKWAQRHRAKRTRARAGFKLFSVGTARAASSQRKGRSAGSRHFSVNQRKRGGERCCSPVGRADLLSRWWLERCRTRLLGARAYVCRARRPHLGCDYHGGMSRRPPFFRPQRMCSSMMMRQCSSLT